MSSWDYIRSNSDREIQLGICVFLKGFCPKAGTLGIIAIDIYYIENSNLDIILNIY